MKAQGAPAVRARYGSERARGVSMHGGPPEPGNRNAPRRTQTALVGRERERGRMDDLLVAGRDGGAALLLWGEPGIGKTSLLDHADRQACGSAATVLRARGVETETVLPFATLGDLLMPHSSLFRELPGAQRSALESCLALSGDGGQPPGNPYAACMGALNVLAALGDARPVVVLVDDLHWVDPSSQRVLLFIARRLAGERVALVLGSREDHGECGPRRGVPTVQLGGLATAECAELLRARGHEVAPAVLAELVRISGGNPLALLEIAAGLTVRQARGDQPLLDPPSLGRHLERAWSTRIDRLQDQARRALVVLAASRSGETGALCKALETAGLSLEALAPAEEDGLIRATAEGLDFHHPVLRPLVLGRAPLAHRFAAFQALAEVGTGALHTRSRAAVGAGPGEPASDGRTAASSPVCALDQLTPQELQVSRAVARGLNNTEAAASLFVSRKTVESHLTRIYRKLGVRSRTDLTRLLTAADLVD
ncbi:AAA family ATPase [Streptomyces sp. HUAS ZL42]|uniref:helix-turn-helix transcriptional regulator n=1 Tax=Streptomyces sp. HUAS ZL42 TaxID=3231715 RepID=UPI00345F15A7